MRGLRGLVAAAVAVTLIAAGCGGSAATPSPTAGATPTATASPTATVSASTIATASPTAGAPTASPTSAPSVFYLRSWSVAPVGPQNSFGTVPTVISDGRLTTAKYPPPADPYPLYARPTGRSVTAAGLTTIVAEARNDGLLGTVTSFVCPHGADDPMMAGTGTDHLVLIVSGVTHELTASCPYQRPTPGPGAPAPATWAAFQRFKTLLSDPASWLGSEAGSESAYDPDKLAVMAVAWDSSAQTPNPANVVPWPLAPFVSFGVASAGARCAVVAGADAATLLPIVKAAYGTTVFRDSGGAFAEVIVRAFMPGEPDPCPAG